MFYYDHILMFSSKEDALSQLSNLGLCTSDDFGGYVYAPLRITIPTGTYYPLEEGQENPTERVIVIPGYFVCVSLHYPSTDLQNLPNNICRLISDRHAMNEGINHLVYTAPELDPTLLVVADVSPVFLGSKYPF